MDFVAAFTVCAAPWGDLHAATTGIGIVAVGLGRETPGFVDGLARRLHGLVLPAEDGDVPAEWRAALAEAARQIGVYFAGYGALARRIGRPGAAQAVGGAMGRSRVIASGGRIGGYGAATYADRQSALAIKRSLLAIEGTAALGLEPC